METRFSKPVKFFLICALSVLVIICGSLLWPRFLYQEGITQLRQKNYKEAVTCFKKAEQAMPEAISTWFARADLFRIYTNLGKALYHLGVKNWHENGLSQIPFGMLAQAKLYLEKADEIDPMHFINSYWMAQTEEGLEKAFPWLHPNTANPHNADPFYQKAFPLRPSGMIIRYAYIKYLNGKGLNEKTPGLVRNLMEIHPRYYFRLKKESFFSDDLIPHIEQGLHQAIEKQILPRDAFKALADIQFSKNDLKQAISYYREFLDHKPSLNSSYDYIHMGRLYLKNNSPELSYDNFEKGLILAESSETSLTRIYRIFKQENRLKGFLSFSSHLQVNGLGNQELDIQVATCWMEMEQFQLARARLIQMNARQPHARAYYLLAKIAQKEKDWDRMEITIQKATRLDPNNPDYYYLFSRALNYQKKYIHAEEAATKAIQNATKENPWYFNHRAWIRWNQKKYDQAGSDWHKAFSLKPDRSDFSYYIAMASEQGGEFKQGLNYIQKAIALAPDNPKYKDLQTRLKTHK